MLEFKSLSKVYPDGTRAANNVCFSVPEGQFCVLLGPSGAGKSTLLKTCNGLTDISYGSVEVDGTSLIVERGVAVLDHISFLIQFDAGTFQELGVGIMPDRHEYAFYFELRIFAGFLGSEFQILGRELIDPQH